MKMDTSEKYIKMCESAKDIQRFCNFENGDYVFDLYDGETMIWSGYPPEEYIKVVWLPRQDQYQKICIDFTYRIWEYQEMKLFSIF